MHTCGVLILAFLSAASGSRFYEDFDSLKLGSRPKVIYNRLQQRRETPAPEWGVLSRISNPFALRPRRRSGHLPLEETPLNKPDVYYKSPQLTTKRKPETPIVPQRTPQYIQKRTPQLVKPKIKPISLIEEKKKIKYNPKFPEFPERNVYSEHRRPFYEEGPKRLNWNLDDQEEKFPSKPSQSHKQPYRFPQEPLQSYNRNKHYPQQHQEYQQKQQQEQEQLDFPITFKPTRQHFWAPSSHSELEFGADPVLLQQSEPHFREHEKPSYYRPKEKQPSYIPIPKPKPAKKIYYNGRFPKKQDIDNEEPTYEQGYKPDMVKNSETNNYKNSRLPPFRTKSNVHLSQRQAADVVRDVIRKVPARPHKRESKPLPRDDFHHDSEPEKRDANTFDEHGHRFAEEAAKVEHGRGTGRMAFQIHGQKGPHSYRFGFDTGKGYNRQFRYEERDGYGEVKGRYGYYDKHGKLQIVNYSAHPKHGFSAQVPHQ